MTGPTAKKSKQVQVQTNGEMDMASIIRRTTIGLAIVCVLPVFPPCLASDTTLHGSASKTKIHHKSTYWQRHPKVKSAARGAGIGTAAGAATGLITHKGVMRGAAIGAGTGAGVGLIHSSNTMKRHPLLKDTAEGSVVGTGLMLAANRHHAGKSALEGGGIGAAAGLGVGLFKNKLR
jgi:hypothetical protein